jgi:hypothetical protein
MELTIAVGRLRIEVKIDRLVALYALGGGSLVAAVLSQVVSS